MHLLYCTPRLQLIAPLHRAVKHVISALRYKENHPHGLLKLEFGFAKHCFADIACLANISGQAHTHGRFYSTVRQAMNCPGLLWSTPTHDFSPHFLADDCLYVAFSQYIRSTRTAIPPLAGLNRVIMHTQ